MYVRLPVLESYIRLCPIADVRLDLQRLQRRGSLACDSDRHLHDPVRRGSLPADAYLPDTPGSKCGSWLACDCLTHQHNFTGCSRDAGLAAPRHGWRVAAPPPPPKSLADYGHTEPERGAEWWGKSVLLTLPLLQSEPPSGRNPKWPLPQQWICTQSNCVDCQAAFASKPAPTG